MGWIALFLFFFGIGAVLGLAYGLIRIAPSVVLLFIDVVSTVTKGLRQAAKDIKAISQPGQKGINAAHEILNRDRQP